TNSTEKKRGRPKTDKGQATVYDFRLQDEDLEEALDILYETSDEYKRHREARNTVKTLLKEKHGIIVAGLLDDDGEEADPAAIHRGPYAICGNWRFLAMAPAIPAKAATMKEIKAQPAKHGWRFSVAPLTDVEPS